MAAISPLLEPIAPAPAASNTPKVAEKSNGRNNGGFEHPAFNKVLKEHSEPPKAEGPKAKDAAAPASPTPTATEAVSDATAEAATSAPTAALPPKPTAPTIEPVTRPELPQALAAKPLKLQALLNAEPTPATEVEAPVLTAPLPEAVATPSVAAAEPTATTPIHLVAPEAFLRWLDTLKTFSDAAAPEAAVTLSSTAAGADRLPAPVAALLAAAAPAASALDALAGNAAPVTAQPADHSPFGLTVAALNTLPSTASPVAEAARLSTPLAMDNADWPQQLGEQIRWRLGEGIQEARIEINPRELGAVDVRLSMDDNGLRVHLSAEQAKTRELLQSELPRLRESLQQSGVQLADAQVGREAPGREGARQHGAHGAFKSEHSNGQGRDDDDARVVHVGGWRTRVGLLDDYA